MLHTWLLALIALTGTFVIVSKNKSANAILAEGVPQGSVHGPLLLILFSDNPWVVLSNDTSLVLK